MRIKIDENLPASIAEALVRLGHDAHTIKREGLDGSSDAAIWRAVVIERRFLITQDVEFADARRTTAPGSPGALLIRMGDADMDEVADRVVELFESEDIESWHGCSVSATAIGVRVHPTDGPSAKDKT